MKRDPNRQPVWIERWVQSRTLDDEEGLFLSTEIQAQTNPCSSFVVDFHNSAAVLTPKSPSLPFLYKFSNTSNQFDLNIQARWPRSTCPATPKPPSASRFRSPSFTKAAASLTTSCLCIGHLDAPKAVECRCRAGSTAKGVGIDWTGHPILLQLMKESTHE